MIVAGMEQGSSANAEIIKSYFEDMELEDLKELMRDGIENGIRERIHTATREGLKAVPDETKITLLEAELNGATVKDFALYYDEVTNFSASTYEDNLIKIGSVDLDSPYTINLYASTFENKDVIVNAIDEYNDSVSQEKVIEYTDFFGFLMSSITTIINAITYVLIAFVAISLIVSSIMIGVITLISVQERTKEIGILRAIGASKRDVSSMFNAETIIIGLASGIIGVGVTYILCLPINLILHLLTGIAMLNAQLPIGAALILIGISVLLTLISGIIPARSAANKDPVVALRTE
jgi:putative ABC transport system permease protein